MRKGSLLIIDRKGPELDYCLFEFSAIEKIQRILHVLFVTRATRGKIIVFGEHVPRIVVFTICE